MARWQMQPGYVGRHPFAEPSRRTAAAPTCGACGRHQRDAVHEPTSLPHPTPSAAERAARWWKSERPRWVLDRALPIWLAYEANHIWDPDDETDQRHLAEWRRAVLDARNRIGW